MVKISAREQEAYIRRFCARTQRLRQFAGWRQQSMADILGISLASYQKYEIRSPLPHYLIEKFARVTGCSVEFLVTGKGRAFKR